MLALERRNLIIEKLQQEKRVVVSELAAEFAVSEEKIRRDLDRLDKEGIATKSYGGAVFNENTATDLPFNVRNKCNVEAKRAIAALAASMIHDGDHIVLDASSTAVYIARAIKDRHNLTVVTNSLEIMIELSDVSGWDVIMTGGRLREGYLALVGPQTVDDLGLYNADKVFFSCKGIDSLRGVTDGNADFARIKQAMLRCGAQKILAADSSKFDKTAFANVCDLKEPDVVITDGKPSAEWLRRFKQSGIEVLYP